MVGSPRLRLVPAAADSEGDLACDLAARYGMTAFPWQRAALVDVMGVRADGRWAASRVGIAATRQNGKNGALEIYELWVMSQLGMRVIHSAHEVKTARKAFKRLLDFFDDPRRYPELRALVREVRRTNGQEAIELVNGGGVEFVARTKSSGRGYSGDVLVLDEAQELTEDEIEAMQPIVSASANSQIILTGTAPKAEKPSTVWRRYRALGAEGADPRLCWIEHSADPDSDPSSRETWAQANPGAPESISWDTIADEFASMSLEGFSAERLGIWTVAEASAGVLPLDLWQSLTRPDVQMSEPVAFSLEVALGRESACIGAAWQGKDRPHVVVAKQSAGVEWVVEYLSAACTKRQGTVTIDGATEAGSFVDKLEAEGVKVIVTKGVDRPAVCAGLFDAVVASGVTHDGDQAVLAAITGATWRQTVEGARTFARRGVTDIAPLYAVALALHGLDQSTDVSEAVW